MNQRFIEMGEGYGDIYELLEIISSNSSRLLHGLIFASMNKDGKPVISVAAVLSPAGESNFMPIYICREGIPPESKRLALFEEAIQAAGRPAVRLEVKPSFTFSDLKLYYNYLTGILRLHHLLPPLR